MDACPNVLRTQTNMPLNVNAPMFIPASMQKNYNAVPPPQGFSFQTQPQNFNPTIPPPTVNKVTLPKQNIEQNGLGKNLTDYFARANTNDQASKAPNSNFDTSIPGRFLSNMGYGLPYALSNLAVQGISEILKSSKETEKEIPNTMQSTSNYQTYFPHKK